jgi:hypothetical protein
MVASATITAKVSCCGKRRVGKGPPTIVSSVGRVQFRAAAERELTDRALDVEFEPRHLREQFDIGLN